MNHKLNLAVVIGSDREGRLAPTVANWFTEQANQHNAFNIDVIDLAEIGLPQALVGDVSKIPQSVHSYTERIGKADAFTFVVPEYNRSFTPVTKSAIDWVHAEWKTKPVSFVSYGGISGGLRAVEQLRLVFAELDATTIRDSVSFHSIWECFDSQGEVIDAVSKNKAANYLLDQLLWWAQALHNHRATHPYKSG